MAENRIWLFRLISITLGLVVAMIMGELMLHVYARHVAGQEQMDEGLIKYHSRLGWKLASGWQGQHRHYDYHVNYSTDIRGFRAGDQGLATEASESVLILGDSFTFGLGVNDSETFVANLNALQSDRQYINAGVPGYSPEQMLLWSDTAVQIAKPGHVYFVVYLGNDLIDLGLHFPVQAGHGKPVAAITIDGFGNEQLEMQNIPVPMAEKPPALKNQTLGSYLLGADAASSGTGVRLFDLVAGQLRAVDQETAATLNVHILKSIRLFSLVYQAFVDQMAARGVTSVSLVLLPGASLINDPTSVAGTYQLMLADALMELANKKNWEIMSLTPALSGSSETIYFPNDGHLTAAGHALVAKRLLEATF